MRSHSVVIQFLIVCLSIFQLTYGFRDRLSEFYQLIQFQPFEVVRANTIAANAPKTERVSTKRPDGTVIEVEYCTDRTKLLPDCNECIPGLSRGVTGVCNAFVQESQDIRSEIKNLTLERYGDRMVANRPFGLYPYLESDEFLQRQIRFGAMISGMKMKNVLDIGAYYSPVNLFFDDNYCPDSFTVIEPILDPVSVRIPCKSDASITTHVIVLPITFKYYLQISRVLFSSTSIARFDAVVCIGCDSHYGPNRKLLETSFTRPYTLFLEYPSEYVHNAAFRKMMGDGRGEKLTFMDHFQANTKETKFTKRVMKIIEYF